MLVVAEIWGSAEDKKALLSRASEDVGVRLVWCIEENAPLLAVYSRRTTTIVTRYDLSDSPTPHHVFSLGDLEDVL
jgi:hypothetical protein